MHVHLETFIVKKGKTSRTSMYVGAKSMEDISKLPECFIYDNQKDGDEHNKVMVWYVTSLEDHEREEAQKRKQAKS